MDQPSTSQAAYGAADGITDDHSILGDDEADGPTDDFSVVNEDTVDEAVDSFVGNAASQISQSQPDVDADYHLGNDEPGALSSRKFKRATISRIPLDSLSLDGLDRDDQLRAIEKFLESEVMFLNKENKEELGRALVLGNRNHKVESWNDSFRWDDFREYTYGDKVYPYLLFQVTSTVEQHVVPVDSDTVHGMITFVLWINPNDDKFNLYVSLRSGHSNIWNKVRGPRDTTFPRKFAKVFLDADSLCQVQMETLFESSLVMGRANEHDIMKKYAVVKDFKALTKNHAEGMELRRKGFHGRKNPPSYDCEINYGQVKVPLAYNTDINSLRDLRFLEMLIFIHETVATKEAGMDDRSWRILDHIQEADAEQKRQFKDDLLEEAFACLDKGEEASSFDLEQRLRHPLQSSFDRNKFVSLKLNTRSVKWADGEIYAVGESLRVIDVLQSLRNFRKQRRNKDAITKASDLADVKIVFEVFGTNRTNRFWEMIDAQKVKEGKAFFFIQGRLYLLHQDMLLETVRQSQRVVQEFILTEDSDDFSEDLEILPWITGTNVLFKTEEFAEFIGVSNADADAVLSVLKDKPTDRSLVSSSITIATHHDNELLDLNKVCPKTNSKAASEEENKEVPKKKRKKDMCKCVGSPNVERKDETWSVENPHLYEEHWDKICKISKDICPTRLIQFLRMYTEISEGHYNELYHLSNCTCKQGSFTYVVGDRITNKNNDQVELFDVMAVEKDPKEHRVYLFHVKQNFDAGAARAACSQVKVSMTLTHDSLVATTSSADAFGKFYDALYYYHKTDAVHYRLTKKERNSPRSLN